MNLLEIFNKVMLELNYRPIEQFENIYKNEHLRILENIRRTNSEVCTSYEWDFLMREEKAELSRGEIDPNFEVNGTVRAIYENGQKLKYNRHFEDFFTGQAAEGTYSVCNCKLVFPKSNRDREFQVFYTTKFTALDETGSERENLILPTDASIISEPYAADVLTYGACVKTKGNPQFAKFAYWNSSYTRALGRMRAECHATREEAPHLIFKLKGG